MINVEYESEVEYVAHVHGNPMPDITWKVSGYPSCDNDDQSNGICEKTYKAGEKDEHFKLEVSRNTIKLSILRLINTYKL